MEWTQQRFTGILDNLLAQAIWVIGAAVGFAVWAVIRSAPDYVIGLAAFGGFALALIVVAAVSWMVRQHQTPKDYWRCPDGKLHGWVYWRGENTGVYMCKNCRTHVDKATLKAHTDQGPLNDLDDSGQRFRGIEFQSHRPPYAEFRKRIEDSSEVWAFWHSGASAKNYNLFETGRVKQLIILSPAHPALGQLAAVTRVKESHLVSLIWDVAKEAQKWGIAVKMWEGHIVAPFTIGNPTNPGKTWVVSETLLPFMNADERPAYVATDDFQKEVCDRFRRSFMQMWNNPQLAKPSGV